MKDFQSFLIASYLVALGLPDHSNALYKLFQSFLIASLDLDNLADVDYLQVALNFQSFLIASRGVRMEHGYTYTVDAMPFSLF